LFLLHAQPDFLAQAARELGNNTPDDGPEQILAQVARELLSPIPWWHHVELMAKVKDSAAHFYYLQATARFGWSRNVLLNQIKARAYERAVTEKKTHNFAGALPAHFAEQADEMLKSTYNLEFLGLRRAVQERELEDRLVSRLQAFLLELGYGFCFVGRQYRLEVSDREFYLDLLFYHLHLRCFVVVDLKKGDFKPEYAGKMNFYCSAVDAQLRHPGDAPTVGLILCQTKDRILAEYSLKDMHKPIGVADYELTRALPAELASSLPSIETLEAELSAPPPTADAAEKEQAP
jgi:predicted nuclease of restriction endonuclease-like (RecB) superfamily